MTLVRVGYVHDREGVIAGEDCRLQRSFPTLPHSVNQVASLTLKLVRLKSNQVFASDLHDLKSFATD